MYGRQPDAHKTLAPVLANAAQIPSAEIGTDFFQETHPEQLFQECSHFCQLVATEKQMPRLLQIAMQTAVSCGGVSVLVLPGDVASAAMTSKELEHSVFAARPAMPVKTRAWVDRGYEVNSRSPTATREDEEK